MSGISAVVATYRRSIELIKLFDSILDNRLQNIEVIIVDQNTDGLIDSTLKEYEKKLEIIHLKVIEPNQSKARNLGAKKAKYPLLCFPDDDCWFENDSLRRVRDYFSINSLTDLLVINWRQNPRVIKTSFQLRKEEMFSFRSVGYVTYVLFFKTEAFKKLGGFMEDIGIGQYIGGGEDSELAFRAISNNYTLYFMADIFVNHKYISIYTRDIPILRSRQRAMGLMYSMYDIPKYVVLRGILSPLLKILIAFDKRKIKEHFNLFLGRLEGYTYGKRNKEALKNHILKDKN